MFIEPCVSKQVIQLGGIIVSLDGAFALLGSSPFHFWAGRLGVSGPASFAVPVSSAVLAVTAGGFAGNRTNSRMAGVRIGTTRRHLASGVVRLVRGDSQLVTVIVLAQIHVVAVCIAAHRLTGTVTRFRIRRPPVTQTRDRTYFQATWPHGTLHHEERHVVAGMFLVHFTTTTQ